MTSQIKKGKRYLVNGYWTLVSTASALLISLQPIMADTIWDRFSKIMRDVYMQSQPIIPIQEKYSAAWLNQEMQWKPFFFFFWWGIQN